MNEINSIKICLIGGFTRLISDCIFQLDNEITIRSHSDWFADPDTTIVPFGLLRTQHWRINEERLQSLRLS